MIYRFLILFLVMFFFATTPAYASSFPSILAPTSLFFAIIIWSNVILWTLRVFLNRINSVSPWTDIKKNLRTIFEIFLVFCIVGYLFVWIVAELRPTIFVEDKQYSLYYLFFFFSIIYGYATLASLFKKPDDNSDIFFFKNIIKIIFVMVCFTICFILETLIQKHTDIAYLIGLFLLLCPCFLIIIFNETRKIHEDKVRILAIITPLTLCSLMLTISRILE